MVNDAPVAIYKNQKGKYITALFHDVNDIVFNVEIVLLYSHEIKIVEQSATNTQLSARIATVLDCYFKGSYWLIKAAFENQIVLFNHNIELEKNKAVHLSFTLK